MCRSKKKICYVHRSLFKKNMFNEKKKELRQKNLKLIVNSKVNIAPSCLFWKRNSLINKNLINKKIGIYNGWGFLHTDITKDFIGFKLSEIHTTRRTPVHKNKLRQKKKLLKKQMLIKHLFIKKKRMGLVLNPVAFRIGHLISWSDAWYMHRINYPVFLHNVLLIKTLIYYVIYHCYPEKRSLWVYSHMNLYLYNYKIFINVFIYSAFDNIYIKLLVNKMKWKKFKNVRLKTFLI